MSITKNWAALLGISGSSAAVTPFVSEDWWRGLDPNGGRSEATTAQITQRAAIVNEFLRSSATLQNREWEGEAVLKFLTAVAPADGTVQAKIGGDWESVLGFERRHGQVGAKYAGSWKPLVELSDARLAPMEKPGPAPAASGSPPPPDAEGQDVAQQLESWYTAILDWIEGRRGPG